MRLIETEVTIAASPEQVWSVLTDLVSYEEWNDHIVRASGVVREGVQLDLEMARPSGKTIRFTPIVTLVDPVAGFEWLGKVGIRGVFDGRHRFELEAVGEGTRVRHSEEFSGVLSGLILQMIGDDTEAGFHSMNESLKRRAESGA